MSIVRVGFGLIFVLLSVAYASAQQRTRINNGLGEFYRVEFEYRNWNAQIVTELEVGPDSTNVSLSDDLAIPDERINVFMGAARLLSWLKARGSFLKQEYDASAVLRRDLTIGGVTFPALSTVDTTLTLEYTTIGAEGDLYASQYMVFTVVGDYTRFRADTVLEVSQGNRTDLGRRELGLLTLGLKLRVYLTPHLSATGEASGMKRDGTGVLTNLDGVLTYNFNQNFAVSFGYQHRYARIDQGAREIFRLKGSYFGASVRF